MSNISKIKLPNGTTYNINDDSKLSLTGGSVTGPVSFGDSVSIDEATVGDLVVNGAASFTNNLQANTINGVTVGSTPKFTDTVTTATTTGSGNAVTAITASDGVLTVTKGSTFLTSSDISGKIDTAGTGLSKSGTTLNHSNSVTAQTTQAIYPIKIDAEGHISEYGSAVTPLTASSTLNAAKLSGAIPSAVTATTQASTDNSTKLATTAFVQNAMSAAGAGTVTSVGVSNATDGGLSVSGSPITSNGTITVGHSNVLSSAQTTSAVYPIKIDKNGHISEYGSAISIPTNWLNGSTTGSVRTSGTTAESSNYTIGQYAVSEGYYTQASGETSHSQNAGTIAQRKSQTALGEYNIADTSGTTSTRGAYAVIVGNGADNNNRSNALTVDWSGNVYSSAANGNLSAVKIVRWTETT